MLFNSIDFLVFFLIVLGLNQLLRGVPALQKLMLLAASYWFYGQWNWMYLGLILASTLVDYTIGLRMAATRSPRKLLLVSLIFNLGILAFFKYANFLIGNLNLAAGGVGAGFTIEPLDILLPVGISFYTFQSLSYTIDVYRGHSRPRRNLIDYALFVSFWPQLVAGPIVRDTEFFSELDARRRLDLEAVQRGLGLILLGLLKKVVLADNLAPYVDSVYANAAAAGPWDALLATYAFAFQIYFDFSGYTDIAIGAALLLGFRFPQNFDHPYTAQTLQDFWRRWHMTLSRWLRDYLYISLGGNRFGELRTFANLMLTMLLGGLWHGAAWTFVIWGGIHGAWLVIERVVFARFPVLMRGGSLGSVLRLLVTFHVVCIAWVYFRAPGVEAAHTILQLATGVFSAAPTADQWALLMLLTGLFAIHLTSARIDWHGRVAQGRGLAFAATGVVALLGMIWFAPSELVPFIYFQF